MTKDKSIFIKNIYYMLSYAFESLHWLDDHKVAKEEFENIHDLFASILEKGLSKQLKQGLYREYINCKESLSVMRGKIYIPGTMQNRMKRKQQLVCEYDELSENNLLNQILKTTCMLLLFHSDVSSEYKKQLKRVMLFFSNVDQIDIQSVNWSSIRFQRNNQSYKTLIGICQMIIEGMLMTTEDGEYKLASFIDDQKMSHLYEKFLLNYYLKEHPELKVSASQIPWALDDECGSLLPVMQSDIMLEDKDGKHILIIDAKYYTHTLQYQYDAASIHSNNLYQIFTYVKNKDFMMCNKDCTISGMLLYAKTDEAKQPDTMYKMSGNKISVKTLDLNTDFSRVAQQLDEIIDDHF